MMEYKGYVAQVEFDDEAEVFHGQVINTRDVITFEGASVPELRQEFERSLEVYLEFCRKLNQEPEKPFSGKLMLRLSPQIHRKAFLAAKGANKSLNAWISECIEHHAPVA
ncbi:MAG: type II toxin-antitoxin system HicB family antitoxin [SAR324 cluster bacterium]|nr:type II toxin-antitoxin system HicB family antitoxin [SAR324 cluster bacterium]